MFNALPRNSIYKWDVVTDEEGFFVIPYVVTGAFSLFPRGVKQGFSGL